MSVLFITIGQRDVQYVLPAKNDADSRVAMNIIGYHNVNRNFDAINLERKLYFDDFTEISRNDEKYFKDIEPVGICFPIFRKTLQKLKQEITDIEEIFLISTNRGEVISILDELKPTIEERGYKEAISYWDYLRNIAKRDITSKSGDKIALELKNNPELFGLNNISVVHLPIGEDADYLHTISANGSEICNSEESLLRLLSKADINQIEFFYTECYKYLQPCFEKLKGKKIFLSMSGGMPLMQRAIEQIFSHTGIGETVQSLYIPEFNNDFIVKKEVNSYYSDFFTQIRLFRQAMNLFHLEQANRLWEGIEDKLQTDSEEYEVMSARLKAVQNEDPFEMNYARFLSAYYRRDYTQLIILIKSLQEQAVTQLWKNYAQKNNKKFVPFEKSGLIKSDCLIINGNLEKIGYLEIFEKEKGWIDDQGLQAYSKLFLRKKNTLYKNIFYRIIYLRNDYLHKGFLGSDSLNKELSKIESFLNMSNNHNSVRDSLNNDQLTAEVIEFEKNFTGESSFFGSIAFMFGKNEDFNFGLREKIQESIELLLKCPLKKMP
jgi:hypothetical protein